MPIYEYRCSSCGIVEAFQRITDGPLARCPNCKRKVTKLISQSSFRLKGSGWYATDYAGKGVGGTGAADSKDNGSKDGQAHAGKGAEKSAGDADGGGATKTSAGDGGTKASDDSSGKKKDAQASKSSAGSEAA